MDPWPADDFQKPLSSQANPEIWLRLCPLSSTSLLTTIFTLAGGTVEDDKTRRTSFFSTHSEGEGRILPNRLILSPPLINSTARHKRLEKMGVRIASLWTWLKGP